MSRHRGQPGPMRHSAGKVVTWRAWGMFVAYAAYTALIAFIVLGLR